MVYFRSGSKPECQKPEGLLGAFQALGSGALVAEADSLIALVNPEFERLSGYSREELVGKKSWKDFVLKDDLEKLEEDLKRESDHQEASRPHEFRLVDRQGEIRHLLMSRGAIPGTDMMVAAFMDITARRREKAVRRQKERQGYQLQKLEAMEKMAGKLAHDFGNLLTAIKGYSDLLLIDLREHDPIRQEIEKIKKVVERAAALTNQLLAFSSRQTPTLEIMDLNAEVGDMERGIRRLIGPDIELSIILEPGALPVKADPHQLEQVIMKLAANAREAMPEGGKLIIKTETAALNISRPEARPGNYACLSVTDTGIGMDEATLDRVFDPFFSTKGQGLGSGLSLSVVHGLIKQHQGWIDVSTREGEGSTFKIYLPAAG
jgi:two-component system cell cycle sensor histidine kinase/response regulator CckA